MLCRRHVRYYDGQFAAARRLLAEPAAAGKAVAEFERAIAGHCGRKHAVAVASGRQGLQLYLQAAGLLAGDEIIFPAYTLHELVLLVRDCGYRPVLVDIEPASMNLDPQRVAAAITSRTRAVVPTHLFGSPCRIDEIAALARRYDLLVIEDCAHALGSSLAGRPVGVFGDAAFFSFELTKPVNTFGGGMVALDDDELANKLRTLITGMPLRAEMLIARIDAAERERRFLRSLLFAPAAWLFYWPFVTRLVNFVYRFRQRRGRLQYARYHPLQAHCGLRQLAELAERNRRRKAVAERLRALCPDVVVWQTALPAAMVNHYFAVVRFAGDISAVRARQVFLRHGVDVGIGAEIADDCSAGACPAAGEVARTAVQIPMHEDLTEADLMQLAVACRAVLAGAGR